MLLPFVFAACSQDTSVEPAQTTAEQNELGIINPFFVFDEDGGRLDLNLKTGAVVPLPADYYCDRSLLAINAEYGKVVTESGEVLLDDESMMNSCDFIGDDNKVLAKTSHYDHAPKETLTYTRGDYKIVGKTVLLNPTDLKKKKDRIFQVTTASYKAVKVGSSSFYLPTVVDGICAIYGAFVNCHFDANANPSITCDKVASRLKKTTCTRSNYFDSEEYGLTLTEDRMKILRNDDSYYLFAVSRHFAIIGNYTLSLKTSTNTNYAESNAAAKYWLPIYLWQDVTF